MKHKILWIALVAVVGWNLSPWSQAEEKKGMTLGGRDGPALPKVVIAAPYVHTVIFYLKKDAPKDETENLIIDTHRLLAKIPSVKGLWIGRPAEHSTPKLAITDYQVSWVLLFENYAGLQDYLEHKLHIEFRDKHAKHAERVLIYDFFNQKK